jgi:hypothetical protein
MLNNSVRDTCEHQLELLELRSTLVSAAKKAEIRRRVPKLILLDDGTAVRMIDPNATRDQRLKYSNERNLGFWGFSRRNNR